MPLYNPASGGTDATITFSDITTNDSSTSKHGFLKKLDNSAGHYMDGTGAWSTPAGSGGGTPNLRLDYNLAADVSNQAITAGTFFDLFANQNFTVGSGSSLVEIVVRGRGFWLDAATDESLFRINIDSAGTPVLKYLVSDITYSAAVNYRPTALIGGVVYVSGLSAATHTIKTQITSVASNNHFYCRASTNGPTTGSEFLNVQVIEHP